MTGPRSPLRTNKYLQGLTPHPKQAVFLIAAHMHDAVLFGGAAGPGKSWALLYAALQYVDVPGYSAILFRRTMPQLKGEGGLIPKSKQMLAGARRLGASFNEVDKKWSFPGGGTLKFASLQYDWTAEEHDGLEYQFVGFDEGTHFGRYQWDFLGTRCRRSAGSPVPIRKAMTSNPGGPGHKFVKSLFGCGSRDVAQPGHFYVPATLDDNPSIDRAAYRKQLERLPPVLRAQKLGGDWDIVASGPLWGEDNFPRYDISPHALVAQHLHDGYVMTCWDCKNKVSTSTRVRSGESFVSGTAWLCTPGRLYLLDEEHGPYGTDDTIKAFWRLKLRWPMARAHYIEDAAMGPEVIRQLKAGVRLKHGDKIITRPPVPGIVGHPAKGKKEDRAAGIQVNVVAGDLWVPSEYIEPWVTEYLAELARAPQAPNDRTDTTVIAVERHLRGLDSVAEGMACL